MNKWQLEFDLQPFTDEIKVKLVMPDGSLRDIIRCTYRNIDGEGFALLYSERTPSDGEVKHGA